MVMATMSPDDPNVLLRAAEQHYANGAAALARPLVETVLTLAPGHPSVLQFHAIVLRALGEAEAALRSIAAAHRAAPADARISDTMGNILSDLGRHEEALAAYARALAADSGFVPARLHRAATLQELGRLDAAQADYASLGDHPDALLALAGIAFEQGAPAAAIAPLERALSIAPANLTAQRARARAAFDCGEPDAPARLAALLVANPSDAELLIEGLAELGEASIVDAVERKIAADPAWSAGRRALALHRRQREAREDWLVGHEAALAARPRDSALWRELIDLQSAAHDFAAAAAAARRAAEATGDVAFLAVAFAFDDAAGDDQAAERLLRDPRIAGRIAPLVLAKHRLRTGDAEQAEAIVAPLCHGETNIEAWAVRSIAWQMLDDPRWRWLNWQPGMVASFALDLDPPQREVIVDRLRELHAASMLYIGHSVRDGTQTRGNLFDRIDPTLEMARAAILDAVTAYRAGLPPADPDHPILRHRDEAWRMTASWSIRLTTGGFHISHIHPKGIVSSASYWVVPPGIEASPERAGWLELGRPPAYLGIALEPIETIAPVAGRLVLFPSTLHHGTRAIAGGERITAAFDLAPGRG